VLVAGVVEHEVEHDPDTALVGLVEQLREIAQRAETRVDAVVVDDVVAAITTWRRVEAGPTRVSSPPAATGSPTG
jgi:hypothetical protein